MITDIKHAKATQKGFTFVELAIVLMIIGLLIGGILRGQELMNISRMNRTMKNVQSYIAAVATFRDQYQAFPADVSNAIKRLPGCTPANSCVDGNADGIIGTPDNFWNPAPTNIQAENNQFWKHLASARLITGVDVRASTVNFGESNPVAPVGGGFTILTTTGVSNAIQLSGTLPYGTVTLRVHGSTTGNVELNPVVSPMQAGYIDRKMDDGKPMTGFIRTKSYGNNAVVANCEEEYTSEENALCTISFVINL